MADEKHRLKELIDQTHKHGEKIQGEISHLEGWKKNLEKLNKQRWDRLHKLEHPQAPPQSHVTMFDSVDVGEYPSNPEAVAGYVDGHWANYNELVRRFPNAHHVSIAVFPSDDAMALDIETGDATPSQAPAWVRRQHARGVHRPILYANLSTMPAVREAIVNDHIGVHEVKLWVAHYNYQPHIPDGYDACQWTDKSKGKNLDESLCYHEFFE